ncbi:hypothetical protein PAMP_000526 [Pampus punctatissimus]
MRLQRDVLLSHQACDSQAAQLDIQEQGSLSSSLNCRRDYWISGGTESHAALPKAASETDQQAQELQTSGQTLVMVFNQRLRCSSNVKNTLFAE